MEHELMARTTKRGKTELRKWMAEQYRKSPELMKRVETLVEQMSIEQDLIALREERGLSQRALAGLAGVKQPVIARIESGKAKNLEVKTVVRIATALGARVRIAIERNGARRRSRPVKRRLAETA
jgi:DNA-binding XRE family transcriptional regulator